MSEACAVYPMFEADKEISAGFDAATKLIVNKGRQRFTCFSAVGRWHTQPED
jgi:hypothetical protein